MRVVILEDSQHVSQRAADIICQTITNQPDAVLGLATGGTPLGTYRELVARYERGEVSFASTTTFNLDEYVGLKRSHPQSYHTFMQTHLFSLADFTAEHCHLPNGDCNDLRAECLRYERAIEHAGRIDLQLLGIGTDGHIAFNEPGSSLASRTRVRALSARTRQDNARYFGSVEEVPPLAITMGVGTILDSRHVLLLATGENKVDAVKAFVEGPVTAQVPASALQLHPQVTVLLDAAAAKGLEKIDYYQHVEAFQIKLETGQF